MPARNEIYSQINSASDLVRRQYLVELNKYTKRDTILYSSFFHGLNQNIPSYLISINNNDIQGFMAALHEMKGEKLDLILHSPGGSLEASEQIIKYLRNKYKHIRAIIPQNAMSAATMIACACDEIVMGKHSALGPIDPQITFDSFTSPAQSILDEFEMAKNEIMVNPALAAIWMKRIERYPTGFIQICKNIIELSKERVTLWLMTWMLKDNPEKEIIAKEVAQWLGTTNIHKTHGKPIDINELKQFKLNVTPLEDDQELQEKILSVFHATMATHDFTQCVKIIENHNGKGHYISAKR